MEKRVRSPNYPALSLPESIEKIGVLYRNIHTHAAPREVIAKNMGYNTLNGASASAVSALSKYGLLEKVGDGLKVSERALRILHPHSPVERAQAIREAAREPQLFGELAERFPGKIPNDELLRNYLLRKGFALSAVGAVILAYRETSEFAERELDLHNIKEEISVDAPHVTVSPSSQEPIQTTALFPAKTPIEREDERSIGRYDFEGGGYVRILAAGNIETEEALDMVETLITLKRRELERRRKAATYTLGSAVNSVSNLDNDESGVFG